MKDDEKELSTKQHGLPWLELLVGTATGLGAAAVTVSKTQKDFIAKFPQINAELGLDIQSIEDFNYYLDEANNFISTSMKYTDEEICDLLESSGMKVLDYYSIATQNVCRFVKLNLTEPADIDMAKVSTVVGTAVFAALAVCVAKEIYKNLSPDNNVNSAQLISHSLYENDNAQTKSDNHHIFSW